MYTTQSSEKITPFGGLNFCLKSYHDSGLAELIDNHLGPRVQTKGFSYSAIFANLMTVFFAGGDCAEDLSTHLREPASWVKGLSVCSADTLLRGVKELACDSQTLIHPKSGVEHSFNVNSALNELLIKALRLTGQLSEDTGYDLDYDNQVIPTEKWDARRTYKKCSGYQPGIASIQNMPVYIEGRNGNSPASYAQSETLQRMFDGLKANGIRIRRFRADSGSYLKKVVEVVEAHAEHFYIRARRSGQMEQEIGQLPAQAWSKVRLQGQVMEIAELPWTPFEGTTSYRLIVSRIKRGDHQGDLFSRDAYTYRGILTNDPTTSPEEIVTFYNQRGASERLFDVMNNDFGWAKLPCSFLNENTAFMILTAICANFYSHLITLYSASIPWLKPTFRLKKFIFRFITVPAKWIRSGRRNILKIYTRKDYTVLLE
jgi:hypothetical protein